MCLFSLTALVNARYGHPALHGQQSGSGALQTPRAAPLNNARSLTPLQKNKKRTSYEVRFLCRRYLSSRSVSRQVFSAQVSLTSVFGMGTGGPSPQSTPTYFPSKRKVSKRNSNNFLLLTVLLNDKSLYSFSSSLSREK